MRSNWGHCLGPGRMATGAGAEASQDEAHTKTPLSKTRPARKPAKPLTTAPGQNKTGEKCLVTQSAFWGLSRKSALGTQGPRHKVVTRYGVSANSHMEPDELCPDISCGTAGGTCFFPCGGRQQEGFRLERELGQWGPTWAPSRLATESKLYPVRSKPIQNHLRAAPSRSLK